MTKPFARPHLTRPLAVVDLQTTGPSLTSDHVVEIAVVKFTPDGDRERSAHRVHPGVPLPAATTAVHGLSDEDVAGCPRFEAIAGRLARFLRPCDLCGFHLKDFTLPFLLAEFARAGVLFSMARRAVIDVLHIYDRHEPRDLAAAVRHYLGWDHDREQRTFADAYAAAAVLDAQLACHDLPRTVPELHAYLAGADPARHPPRANGWPVRAFNPDASPNL